MLPKCLQPYVWVIECSPVCSTPRPAHVLLPIAVLIVHLAAVRTEHLVLGLVKDIPSDQMRSDFDRWRSGGTTGEVDGGKGEHDVFHEMGLCELRTVTRRFNYRKLSSANAARIFFGE